MINFFKNTKLLASGHFLCALYLIAVFCLVNQSHGMYFEDYETLANQTIIDCASSNLPAPLLSTENFLLYPLLVKTQILFPNVPVYSMLKLSFILFVFFSLCIITLKLQLSTWLKVGLIGLTPLLFLSNIILVNNVRISLLLGFAAFAYLFTIKEKAKVSQTVFFLILIIASVLNRIEMAVIASVLGVLVVVLLGSKSTIKLGLLGLVISILSLFALKGFIQVQDEHNMKEFSQYESAIYDRKDFTLEGDPLSAEVSGSELKGYAAAFFLMDRPTLSNFDYSTIIGHESLFSYVFKNEKFISIYAKKMTHLLKNSHRYFAFLLYPLLLTFMLVLWKSKKRKSVVFLGGIYFMVPAILHGMGVVPNRFLAPYLAFGLLALSIVLLLKFRSKPIISIALLITLILVALGNFQREISSIYQEKMLQEEEAQWVQEFMQNDLAEGKKIFFNYLYYEYIPSKLFRKTSDNLEMIYLDAGSMGDIRYFKERNKQHFGEGFQSILHRYQVLDKENSVVYSSPFMMSFQLKYLEEIHGTIFQVSRESLGKEIELQRYMLKN